ncbi:MAG: NAD(P)H-dependent oxidoreductase subunit E [Chloroflexi bacterium]|nr:NAD(P)H-dependent oxidoreductase subunit E [Chloroflexota bacterium]
MALIEKVDGIVEMYGSNPGGLIAILQDIQDEYRYLDREAIIRVAHDLKLPVSQVYSVANFYNAFSLAPTGKHIVSVCLGTACYVKGAGLILDRLEREMEIKIGETTGDRLFTLQGVRCLGCCSIAPVITIDGEIYGEIKQERISKILESYK